jgi:hypothetical protein
MEELAKQLGITTVYATATYGFFHWLDEKASDEAKAALARTMRWKDYKSEQVASALVEVFDRIYTYPLLRWRAFFRSFLFTTVVSAIYPFEAGRLYWEFELVDVGYIDLFQVLLAFLIVTLPFNVCTDYLSLFVIRPLLIRSGAKPVIGLALGAMSGAAIVLAANTLRYVAVGLILHIFTTLLPASDLMSSVLSSVRRSLPWGAGWSYRLLLVWPALAVFVWLPLFALGIVVARLLTPLSWIVLRTQWFLKEGKEHPLKAIGYVAAVIVFIGTVAGRAVFSA